MQPRLGDLAIGHQTPPMTHRRTQRLNRRVLPIPPTKALPGQVRQRRTVAIIGLEPPRPTPRPVPGELRDANPWGITRRTTQSLRVSRP